MPSVSPMRWRGADCLTSTWKSVPISRSLGVVERLEELYGPIIVAEGRVWRFDHTHWAALDDGHLARFVHRADGAQYLDANGNVGGVRLNKNRIPSIAGAAEWCAQRRSITTARGFRWHLGISWLPA